MKNPYVENLIEMGYDRADCETVAVAGVDKTFPLNIHGRVYQTQEEYDSKIIRGKNKACIFTRLI